MRSAAALLAATAAADLIAVPALAADIVRPAAPAVAAPVVVAKPAGYNWNGCTFGLLAGYGWGTSRWSDSIVGTFSDDQPKGGIAGGQIGCDAVHGNLVLGVESQLYWANIDSAGAHTSGTDSWVDTTHIPAVLTITGRVGVLHDRSLWYLKGGAAGADVTYNDTGDDTALSAYEYQFSHKRWGYLIGGGVEVALHDHWSLKVEYDFMNLGSQDITLHPVGSQAKPGQPTETFTSAVNLSTLLVGLNYRFK